MTSDPQLREQSRQGEEVEILNLKRSKLQKRRLLRHPPARCRPCRASSTVSPAFCTIWSQLTSANEAKSNKSVPPQQHTRLPAAQGSLCQDTDGMGERSACIPENALAEKLITHPVPPTIRKGCGKANSEKQNQNRTGRSKSIPLVLSSYMSILFFGHLEIRSYRFLVKTPRKALKGLILLIKGND
ncbi:hypothetical protein TURU_094806 [Turdus rufiventris]|nr:hypothetical protein TURU_094806 [Turdus rufiventris]